jgi:hypothetical protein
MNVTVNSDRDDVESLEMAHFPKVINKEYAK